MSAKRIPPVRLGCSWNLRKAGGLNLGIRIQFPILVLYDNGETRMTWFVSVGLVAFTLSVTLSRKFTP